MDEVLDLAKIAKDNKAAQLKAQEERTRQAEEIQENALKRLREHKEDGEEPYSGKRRKSSQLTLAKYENIKTEFCYQIMNNGNLLLYFSAYFQSNDQKNALENEKIALEKEKLRLKEKKLEKEEEERRRMFELREKELQDRREEREFNERQREEDRKMLLNMITMAFQNTQRK
eukprot:GCRY01003258.1.p2 GENE.GCRY01003258.1~~GCRY01003258.1.p2  ORF type:complete len:173 (-),score=36.80 GCRY01003258.1:1497-2015(-)